MRTVARHAKQHLQLNLTWQFDADLHDRELFYAGVGVVVTCDRGLDVFGRCRGGVWRTRTCKLRCYELSPETAKQIPAQTADESAPATPARAPIASRSRSRTPEKLRQNPVSDGLAKAALAKGCVSSSTTPNGQQSHKGHRQLMNTALLTARGYAQRPRPRQCSERCKTYARSQICWRICGSLVGRSRRLSAAALIPSTQLQRNGGLKISGKTFSTTTRLPGIPFAHSLMRATCGPRGCFPCWKRRGARVPTCATTSASLALLHHHHQRALCEHVGFFA